MPPHMTVLASNSVLGAAFICARQAAGSGVDEPPIWNHVPDKTIASNVGCSFACYLDTIMAERISRFINAANTDTNSSKEGKTL